MQNKKFEIVLINDKKKLVAEPACIERDECWVDFSYCKSTDSCILDYAPGTS